MIGGGFLQSVFNLPVGLVQNIAQITQSINMLQSLSMIQGFNVGQLSSMFTSLQGALSQFSALGFTGTYFTNAMSMLSGLQGLTGFTNGLFGFMGSTNLNSLLDTAGQNFLASLQNLLGTGFLANIKGLSYLSDAFSFLSSVLPSSDGVDLLSTLPTIPSLPVNLNNFGFLQPIIDQFGSNGADLQNWLDQATRLVNELKGQAFLFHSGHLNSDAGLARLNTLIAQMNNANLLLDQSITGADGIPPLTNMLEILSTFDR